MTSPATAFHPFPADQADPADLRAEDALYFRRVLHGLIERGADMARLVHETATAPAEADEPAVMTLPEATAAFDLCARTVRRTVALARRVSEPERARAASRPERDRVLARRRVLREVEDAIQREAEGADVDALEAELRERLDAPELDDEIGSRPVAEVVADICRDLGLGTLLGNHPWKRRLPADVQALCARAAKPPGGPPAAEPAHDGQPGAEPPQRAPEVGGRFRTWSGPPAYNRDASIELMHKLLEHKLPRIRGP